MSLATHDSDQPSSTSKAIDHEGLAHFYNASHLRKDTWDSLRANALRLARGSNRGNPREAIEQALAWLTPIESYWAFPGRRRIDEIESLYRRGDYEVLAKRVEQLSRALASNAYRSESPVDLEDENTEAEPRGRQAGPVVESRPYFEVLVVDDLSDIDEERLRNSILERRTDADPFVYDVVIVPSLEDALIAALFNHNVQACLLRYSFPVRSKNRLEILRNYLATLGPHDLNEAAEGETAIALAQLLRQVRPELDLYLVTDSPVEEIAGSGRLPFRRVFYRQEDYRELHANILKGVSDRYRTPFFSALKSYSQRPTGVFHAMPLSRGKSIDRSHWIKDMSRFYGHKIFDAETSATTGGLDSLLQPQGTLRDAQQLAARAFGAKRTFFVTNGTSAANKIVAHALLRPGDIAMLTRDCHKSHHYAMQLSGAYPLYLNPYPLSAYSFYGAVPLDEIKKQLRELERAGKLDSVRMLLLTNCTFDGITYDPERVMEEVLAIKPDMIFLWDEAWFAFATFHPTLRRRTAMAAARRLAAKYRSAEYREKYRARLAAGGAVPEGGPTMPDPERVRIRVYATQSTHKTLTALRQGSMIHIYDQDFEQKAAESFGSAYMTYTSTSPNYQILASLDIGRRQVELEGYELVQQSIELSMILRSRLESNPLLRRFFRVLRPADLIPAAFRPSGIERYYCPESGWRRMETAWLEDEFALDPTRVTLQVSSTGMDGDTFKNHLIDHYDIQINKTARNSVLFMVHIGTSRGAMAHLIEVLARIAESLDDRLEDLNPAERAMLDNKIIDLTENMPPLPDFSSFYEGFLPTAGSTTREGDLRRASFLAYDSEAVEYLAIDGALAREMKAGREAVSAGFVTPYPPGFPVLVPGQVISPEILDYLRAVDVKEIHGYRPEFGLRVFTETALRTARHKGT